MTFIEYRASRAALTAAYRAQLAALDAHYLAQDRNAERRAKRQARDAERQSAHQARAETLRTARQARAAYARLQRSAYAWLRAIDRWIPDAWRGDPPEIRMDPQLTLEQRAAVARACELSGGRYSSESRADGFYVIRWRE